MSLNSFIPHVLQNNVQIELDIFLAFVIKFICKYFGAHVTMANQNFYT